jgi:uncharacterized protein (DUF952 family)
VIYKLLSTQEWVRAREAGRYDGSEVDRRDGFIHLSGAHQVVETARRHFAGQTGLTLLAVDPAGLGADLRWETSRGGEPFPHLYAPLPASAVTRAYRLPDGAAVPEAVAALLAPGSARTTAPPRT